MKRASRGSVAPLRFAVALLALSLAGPTIARDAEAVTNAQALEKLRSDLQAKMKSIGLVGLGASVIVDREIVWSGGFGYANWQRTRPFTDKTVMNAASVAKPFVGVTMMQAVEAGKLNLDEDINRYLPFKVVNPYHPGAKITLRHLATHTSGITDRWEAYLKAYDFDGDPKQSLGDYLKNYFQVGGSQYSKKNFLEAKPGEERDYSNIAAALAGYIVERVTGMPLNESTKKRIFQPLQMNDSGWFLREIDRRNHSDLFAMQNGHAAPLRTYGLVTYPEGGLRTSVSDLSKFFIAMLNNGVSSGNRILSEASAKEMQRFQFSDLNRPKNFSADQGNSGLFWRTKFGGARIGHGGSDPGVGVEMLASKDRSVGIVMMTNTSVSGEDGAVMGEIVELLWAYGEAVKRSRQEASSGS